MVRRLTTAAILAAIALFLAAGARASDDLAAQSDFFREGVSARSFGLGSAFTGLSDDATAIYWNPAGLGLLRAPQIITTKTSLNFFDSDVQSFVAAAPYGKGVWGVNYVYTGTDVPLYGPDPNNPLVATLDPATVCTVVRCDYPLGISTERYMGLSLGYGMLWKNTDTYVGMNIKTVKYNLGGNSESGTGFDVAAMKKLAGGSTVGVNLQNIGNIRLGVMDKIPFNVQVGASRNFGRRATAVVGYDSNYLGQSALGGGVEYKVAEYFTARAGTRDGKIAYGFSINLDSFQLDYAMNSGSTSENEMNKLTVAYYLTPHAPKRQPQPTAKKPEAAPPKAEAKPPEKKPAETTAKKEEKPAAKKEPPKKEPVAKAPEKKEEPKKEAPVTPPTKQEVPVVTESSETEGAPSVKLPSIQELLGETTDSGKPSNVFVNPAPNTEPQRFPSEQGEFGLSNEYDGKIP